MNEETARGGAVVGQATQMSSVVCKCGRVENVRNSLRNKTRQTKHITNFHVILIYLPFKCEPSWILQASCFPFLYMFYFVSWQLIKHTIPHNKRPQKYALTTFKHTHTLSVGLYK